MVDLYASMKDDYSARRAQRLYYESCRVKDIESETNGY